MMKRFFTLLLMLLPLVSWGQGNVSISDADGLKSFAQRVNDGETDLNAVLTANIDLNPGITFGEDGAASSTPDSWTPIGSQTHPYGGTFDGAGHTISGIYINTTEATYQGFFGYTEGATIQNVGVVNSYINANNYVGGIVGDMDEGSVIAGCYNAGVVISNKSSGLPCVGGIVGTTAGGSSVIGCYSTNMVKVTAPYGIAGGIIGASNYDDRIINCYNLGLVNGGEYAYKGNIVGQLYSSEVVSSGYLEGNAALNGIGNIYYEVEDAKSMTATELLNAMNTMNEALQENGYSAIWVAADYDSENQELLLPRLTYSDVERAKVTQNYPCKVTIIVNDGTATGAGFYDKDDEVTVVATANNGYEFVSWADESGVELSSSAEYTFTISKDVILVANFQVIEDPVTPPIPDYPDYYNIYMDACEGVTADTSTDVVREGSSMTFTLEVADGYTAENMVVKFKRSMFGYWETVTPDADGTYQIRNIYTDIYIQITGVEEENPTGIEQIAGVQVYTRNGSLFIQTPQQEQVSVISISGTVLKKETVLGLRQFDGLQRGVYIVCVGNGRIKVRL